MADKKTSLKHGLISKSNQTMFIALAVAGAVLSFSLVGSYSLIKRMNYQSKVIGERQKAEAQLKENIDNMNSLMQAYQNFDEAAESVIGTGDSNSTIVLDALPSKYDFPALATSLDKILVSGGFTEIAISGSDEEATAEQNSSSPAPIEIPFGISATGSYERLQRLMADLQRSIRPFRILKFDIGASSGGGGLQFTISGVTYYQPEKNLEIEQKEVL